MNSIEFNKIFFPRNNDRVYQLALMFTKYGSARNDVLEYLFFANHEAIVSGVNLLSFLEQFNENFNYTLNWIKDLTNVNNEADWVVHRSKLITKFCFYKDINAKKALEKFQNETRVFVAIRNASILWNNFVNNIEYIKYAPEPKITWELWDILKSIEQYKRLEVAVNDSHLNHFSSILKNRANDEFCKNNKIGYEAENKEDLEEMTKKIGLLLFKGGLENKLTHKVNEKKIIKI